MIQFGLLWKILKRTHSEKILWSYIVFILVDAGLIWIFEPDIHTYREALWYCYAVVSTAGFGDLVATMPISRILSVMLTLYSVIAVAILTGVIVNYYNQIIEMKNKETVSAFMDKIEHLPELSKEELVELSEKVKKFR